MRLTLLALIAALAMSAASASAEPVFKITELYTGITGEDGSSDWIEVTNFGTMNGDTSTLWYDDESASVAAGVQLPSFELSPGDSAVFLVTGDATMDSIAEFTAVWGSVPNLGFATGGGGLSQGGDAAFILLGDDTVVDSLVFPGLPSESTATVTDPTGRGPLGLSAVGVGGAYESVPFFNDNLGGTEILVTLVGSPGFAVPEPVSAVLAMIAAAGIAARRR